MRENGLPAPRWGSEQAASAFVGVAAALCRLGPAPPASHLQQASRPGPCSLALPHSPPAFLTPRSGLLRFLRSLICLRDFWTASARPFCNAPGARGRTARHGQLKSVHRWANKPAKGRQKGLQHSSLGPAVSCASATADPCCHGFLALLPGCTGCPSNCRVCRWAAQIDEGGAASCFTASYNLCRRSRQ